MSIEDKLDFKKFIQRIYISKNSGYVYNMWANNELIEKWYVKSASYYSSNGSIRNRKDNFEAGDTYLWEWVDGTILNGKILEADKKENIKFTFGNDVIVSVNLRDIGGRTLVELIQEQNMDDPEMNFSNYMACLPGWVFYLNNLKSLCEGGIDLREENPDVDFLSNI